MTRLVANDYRPRLMLFSQLLIGTLVLSPFGLTAAWPEFDLLTALLIFGSAAGSGIGNYLVVIANRQADASLIAPLIYTQLISATLAGYIVFGDWPDPWSLFGLLIILVSGMGSLWLVRRTH
jgi:drug/metabolite transporter (DMT)-like permease